MPALSIPAALPRFRHRWAAVACLLIPAPPLYGTVAVLIREITRRTGRVAALLLMAVHGLRRQEPSAC